MRKPAFCIIESKGADQLQGNLAAAQPLVWLHRPIVQSVYFLFKSKFSSLQPSSVAGQSSLSQTGLETHKTGFLVIRHNLSI